MKMNEGTKRRFFRTCKCIAELIARKKPTEAEKAYASNFVGRVLRAVNDSGKEGCRVSDITSKFDFSEADLMDHTLLELWRRNVLKREVRYFVGENK